jgi:CMP-N-acetylneuraminic acid synthetase
MRVVAIVPMRHTSERVPGKNYRPLGGRPLFHHIIQTLRECPSIDQVVIDTDSPFVTESAQVAFPDVIVIDRPHDIRGGDVPMTTVLAHDITQVPADLYLQTHTTNPLLRAVTIESAIETFGRQRAEYDSLFTVTPLHTRLWTEDGKPLNHDPSVLLRTQDLPPVMEENSCLYLFAGDLLERTGRRIGERPLLYPVAAYEAWDIDDELDWLVVEALYGSRAGGLT